MLIVIGEAEAAPGHSETLRAAVIAVSAATRTDDGCESYGFYADVIRPEVIVSVEVWRDREALDAHLAHEHTAEFLAAIPGLLAMAPTMRFFEGELAIEERP